ncbi:MAG TPA: FkbM family methyltransferase [Magnetospirillaceae bacterium]|jgi:FkbM family methyltransferase
MAQSSISLPPLPRVALTPRRWFTFAAHTYKATAYQHHRELVPALNRLIGKDAVVFDVGAHSGQFATLFARLASNGVVYSFEPGRYARMILTFSLALNRASNVRVFPIALGDKAGPSSIRMPIKRSGSFGFGLANLGTRDEGRQHVSEPIDVATLDGLVGAMGVTQVDFVKADIEGWEMRMLVGGRAMLERFHPTLWLEMVDSHLARAGDSIAALWAFLTGLGYQPLTAHPDGNFTPIDQPAQGDIVWVTAERARALTTRAA